MRIVIADDHGILREGLRSLLERQEDFCVVGEAGDGKTALASVTETSPDVLLLDISLPDESGIEVARKVVSARPELKVVILSANLGGSIVREALKAGASGYLAKEEASDELVRAIRTVMIGQVYLSPAAATGLASHLNAHLLTESPSKAPALSARELEVLKLVVEGLRNKEIADRLGIGTKSVESYRARLMAKAGCTTPAELVRFALRERLITP